MAEEIRIYYNRGEMRRVQRKLLSISRQRRRTKTRIESKMKLILQRVVLLKLCNLRRVSASGGLSVDEARLHRRKDILGRIRCEAQGRMDAVKEHSDCHPFRLMCHSRAASITILLPFSLARTRFFVARID